MEGWKWVELDGLLPPKIGSRLAAFMLRYDEERCHGICWGEIKMSIFSVKSTYNVVTRPMQVVN